MHLVVLGGTSIDVYYVFWGTRYGTMSIFDYLSVSVDKVAYVMQYTSMRADYKVGYAKNNGINILKR